MSVYPEPPPAHNHTSAILTFSVVVSLLLLFGIGTLFWLAQNHLLLGPTPTPTATHAPPAPPTPDIRATSVQEDMLTQIAYSTLAPAVGSLTPAVAATEQVYMPSVPNGGVTPTPNSADHPPPAGSATTTTNLPWVSNDSPLALPTATPVINSVLPTPTPIVEVVPNTVQPTATPAPSATPTFIPTPTPTIYLVDSLNGVIRNSVTTLRLGPSNLYAEAGTLPANSGVRLLGRDGTGEWVYVCCVDNVPHWVRQAYAPPRDNPTLTPTPTGSPVPTTTPTEINPNDVRWLPVQPLASSLEPLPPATLVPANDYPWYRHDLSNRARVPNVPRPPLTNGWSAPGLAGGGFTSAIVVGGQSVLAASTDNQLYSFDRLDGHQRWRFNVGQHMQFAPTVQDANLYIVDDTGRLFALQDQGNTVGVSWQRNLPKRPTGGVVVAGNSANKVYVSISDGQENQLYALDRNTGEPLNLDFRQSGPNFQPPVVGHALLYIGGQSVWALDMENFELVWQNTEVQNVTIPPIYTANGVVALAELYVVDNANHLYSLDANTGSTLWRYDNDAPITGIAVNGTTLFMAGNGYVKAITRGKDHAQLWRTVTNGAALGGPIVDQDEVLLITDHGDLQYMNAVDGTLHNEAPLIQSTLGGAAAVSGLYIFAPGTNGSLYAIRANQ